MPSNRKDWNLYIDRFIKLIDVNENNYTIVLGDMNTILDFKLDHYPPIKRSKSQGEKFKNIILNKNLIDISRIRQPDDLLFTRVDQYNKSSSRIDYIFISENISNMCSNMKKMNWEGSDHLLIYVKLKMKTNVRRNTQWKFNKEYLDDKTKCLINNELNYLIYSTFLPNLLEMYLGYYVILYIFFDVVYIIVYISLDCS